MSQAFRTEDFTQALLVVRGLSREHGSAATRVSALRGVDLDVYPGEFVAVTGASGSGKSTLLHLVAGLDRPTAGSIRLRGVDVAALGEDDRARLRRRHIGMVFQSFHLLETLTAEENVALALAIAGRPPVEARRQAARWLGYVGLASRRTHRPHELSGGEQQRIAVARALVIEPTLLLADEPTGNLDSHQGERVLDLLRQVTDERRQTLILVTHDPRHAARADRVIFLHDGRISAPAGHSLGLPATAA